MITKSDQKSPIWLPKMVQMATKKHLKSMLKISLQNKPKNMASRPRLNRPTTLRPSRPSPAETLIYETVDKPAQVGIFFPKNLRNFREMEGIFHVKRNRSLKTFPNRPPKICIQSKTKVKSAALQPFSLPKVFNPILL